MISYKRPYEDINITVPVLHRVYLSDRAWYYRQSSWCRENCRAPFYFAPGWTEKFFVEFDDDEDAVLFALRWA